MRFSKKCIILNNEPNNGDKLIYTQYSNTVLLVKKFLYECIENNSDIPEEEQDLINYMYKEKILID
ncbi:hypothetical protein [Oceanirhabdus seepicola]|uniref:Uncharacterized protein n=1 Tax=Oceanirhabdus seepicola TaxID=2828781 RepID=A0A9J6P1S4_9CLOT|nr:hypothetical protein [Oceanirhabdus seepicola]MCM1990142.1 hypothetical protein [Oceanirhabdus seepicola]